MEKVDNFDLFFDFYIIMVKLSALHSFFLPLSQKFIQYIPHINVNIFCRTPPLSRRFVGEVFLILLRVAVVPASLAAEP